ncbi:MAG: DUF3862 domain-containing protein [Clostridia bacterium]|nr:DUF3862 domain-containing protein [Clostridia bacterium]
MKKILKATLIFLCLSAVILSFASCDKEEGISLKEFNSIETGMTYEEVCDIIGCEGELISSADLNVGSEYASEIYSWKGETGIIGANASVTFQGGKVISKAQFGLE